MLTRCRPGRVFPPGLTRDFVLGYGTAMTLTLHNTLTRRAEPFAPIDPGHVRLYLCGPTVYDRPHIGNARPMVVFDVLVRLLRATYPRVTYARNVTDIDDKIIARAAEAGEPIASLTDRTTAAFQADMTALGCAPPDVEPRATAHVPEMVALIARLIAGGHAYAADGHVLFAVASFSAYGSLSGLSPDELRAGARVEVAPYKRDAGDFVLWKPSTPEQPGWESPWGRGRPGWHIECSAMAERYLGPSFDIHGGGRDLIFPHHENEIAQSRCGWPDESFARVWLHNGMLRVEGAKMSKSLGNFRTVAEVLATWPAEAARLALLRAQYRSDLDFGEASLGESRRELDRFYRALARHPGVTEASLPEKVRSALEDDLNTPAALAAMHALADAALAGDAEAAGGLLGAGAMLGLLRQAPEAWFTGGADAAVEALVAERETARRARDWARADAIRTTLAARGVAVEDGAAGPRWRRA